MEENYFDQKVNEESINEILSNLDINNIKVEQNTSKEKESLEQRFSKERIEWTQKVESMSKKLQKVFELNDLMTTLYTERQRLVEYYHYLLSLLTNVNRNYRKEYAAKYDYYSWQSSQRFPNETSKNNKILSELENTVKNKELLDIQCKFVDQTIKNMDNIIWAIPHRIKLEELARGK